MVRSEQCFLSTSHTDASVQGGDPAASLHGGPKGFDSVEWKVSNVSDAELFSEKEKTSLSTISAALFSHTSEDGDQGYPGKLYTEVAVFVLPPPKASGSVGSVVLVYRAKLLDANVVTPINLTQVRRRYRHGTCGCSLRTSM